MELKFWKYEGAGNDFVILRDVMPTPEQVCRLCDRHRGVGADGLIVLSPEEDWDFRMTFFNSDGGQADMCGNGARCIALFAYHQGVAGEHMRFIGRDGGHTARILSEHEVEVGMCDVAGVERVGEAFVLNTGVPHFVEMVDDVSAVDVIERGRKIRNSMNANVNFAAVKEGVLYVRTYERGVEGETLACGTGATAAAIATYISEGKSADGERRTAEIHVAGGVLHVGFDPDLRNVTLAGPAKKVFEGVVWM